MDWTRCDTCDQQLELWTRRGSDDEGVWVHVTPKGNISRRECPQLVVNDVMAFAQTWRKNFYQPARLYGDGSV